MIFGDLTSVLENEQSIYEAVKSNFNTSYTNVKKPSRLSKILTALSNYGMSYDDDVYRNMVAIPADKALQPKDEMMLQQALAPSTMLDNWKIKSDVDKSFTEKTLSQKREILRKMAMQPELEDILDVMANECIVYDDEQSYICQPFLDNGLIEDLNEKAADELRNSMDAAFYKIYLLLSWKHKAWDSFKRFLIEGDIAYEIIYDNLENPKSITGIVDLDPATLTRSVEDGVTYWVQFKDVQGRERKLLDAQVIYIKYEDSGVSSRQSYLERLIRPFNIYRIIEQAQIIWTVTQSSFKTFFTIPTQGLNRAKSWQTLAQTMNRYKEDISFNVDTGELQVNGKVNLPFNKEYWLQENDSGAPQIETIVDNGPQLNDSDQIKLFEGKLYKMSKIPASRFSKEDQATWFGTDPTSALREEIDFGRFVTRLRNTFAEIILKPVKIQIALSLPDIKNDKRILDSISMRFNSYNLFEEQMNIEVMSKRIDFISAMKDSLVETDAEGNEVSYWSPRFLIQKYLKMSDADIELNEKYKLEDKLKKQKEGGGEESEEEADIDAELGGEEGGGEDLGGGAEDEGSSDIDSEMMGNVQPESPETTQP